jgi:UTP--glucose-1-phosphate uridylyltransferase
VDVPLLLMNSFNTDADTHAILRKYGACKASITSFNQSQYPRILRDTMSPAPESYSDKDGWYPPGHGDLCVHLIRSLCPII